MYRKQKKFEETYLMVEGKLGKLGKSGSITDEQELLRQVPKGLANQIESVGRRHEGSMGCNVGQYPRRSP